LSTYRQSTDLAKPESRASPLGSGVFFINHRLVMRARLVARALVTGMPSIEVTSA
jgi:hypothetical protein